MAKALWQEIYESSDNDVMKETAEHALKNILRDELADSLASRAEMFRASTERAPTSLSELVTAGLLRKLPHDPFGGEYFIDAETGKILSTSAVSEQADRTARYVKRLIERYRDQEGDYPRSLADLEGVGLVESIPHVDGARPVYDSANGTVDYVITAGRDQ